MNDCIHIALATDDNYVDFAMIVINSVIRWHDKNGLPLFFHILTNGLSECQKKRFEYYAGDKVKIKEYVIDMDKFAQRWNGINRPTMWRLELAERLPDVDKVIYLDCDVVVLDDIEKMWLIDLAGKPIGGIGDRAGLHDSKICYCKKGFMFNAGVIMLDLAMWRRENHVPQLVDFWKENQSWMNFFDQGLLNAYFDGNYCLLPQKWNIINSVYRNPAVKGMYSDEEVTDAIRNPGIVHFTGKHKPWSFWKNFHHPYAYTFCLCAFHTPIDFGKKLRLWLKLHLHGWFVDSKHKLPWSCKDVKKIKW